ncbi:hypothetical protein [Tenacibaculum soleae]|uniref:hypothetical protein n=1 Tax=Tenacibaculum soleae TaxID=447689 RepID=UPI002300A9C6|nr:hypothetical protein [Tenacibaculum soleae]
MTQIATKTQLKKYKYIIGSVFIVLLFIMSIYNLYKKEHIYIYYDNYADCNNLLNYEKKSHPYGMCYKGEKIFFNIKNNRQIKKLKNIKDLIITSKKEMFEETFFNRKNNLFFLVVKKEKKYLVIPIELIKYYS